MEKKMHKERAVRLPRIMGPVDRWQGKCVPTDAYTRLDASQLSESKREVLDWIHDYYREYVLDEYLVENRSEPVLLLICEFPNFEGYETTAFNLHVLEQKLEEGDQASVEEYFRIPEPAHWEAGVELQREESGRESD